MTKDEYKALEQAEASLSVYIAIVIGDLWEPDMDATVEERLFAISNILDGLV